MNREFMDKKYSEITPDILALSEICKENSSIDNAWFSKYKVFRGLRDLDGNGVLTGLTEISEIQAFKMVDGQKMPCDGQLFYRGYNVKELVDGFVKEERFGFEETVYLLLFGKLPNQTEMA
ncbi:MAG: citrate/2-methylcitrate synthase, partial [Anaerovoracaceae bacterium]|nr:citrate/2-methylcitrate synthase [Anaerovoracaceae bacterium]